MYLPSPFRLDDDDAREGIQRYPFAALVASTPDGLVADHLPLWLTPARDAVHPEVLQGHLARANPLSAFAVNEREIPVVAIFQGPQAYITPSWYPAKQAHGKVVPTWNYEVVHVHGRLRFVDDPTWLRDLVRRLSERFERDRAAPWSIDDAPESYIEAMCRGIVGVEIRVTGVEGKRKASQHKPLEERLAVRRGLIDEGRSVADAERLSGFDSAISTLSQ